MVTDLRCPVLALTGPLGIYEGGEVGVPIVSTFPGGPPLRALGIATSPL